MIKKIVKIKNKNFEYSLKRIRKTRSIRLAIYSDGHFVVTAPKWYPLYVINRFLAEKAEWIWEKLSGIDFIQARQRKIFRRVEYEKNKESARRLIGERVEFFNRHYKLPYNRLSVKNQKTCWGSASRKGNLNFNYKIINLPAELQDYIIVHELCHLEELNHSQKFWKLVSEALTDYARLKEELKEIEKNFL